MAQRASAAGVRRLATRGVLGALLAAVILAAAVGGLFLYIGRTPPEWYAPPDPQDQDVARLADRVEYRIVEEAQRIRPTHELWTLRIREHQINAWLSARLRSWIAHEQGVRWPSRLGTPQVHLVDGAVRVALPVDGEQGRRVVVAQVRPAIDDGGLTMRLDGVQLGRLSVPGNPMETLMKYVDDFIPAGQRSSFRGVVELLSGEKAIEPVLELSDGRHVEITAITCHDGAIDLTSRTLLKWEEARRVQEQ